MLSRSQIFGGDKLKTFRGFKEKGQIISNLNLFKSCNDCIYFQLHIQSSKDKQTNKLMNTVLDDDDLREFFHNKKNRLSLISDE